MSKEITPLVVAQYQAYLRKCHMDPIMVWPAMTIQEFVKKEGNELTPKEEAMRKLIKNVANELCVGQSNSLDIAHCMLAHLERIENGWTLDDIKSSASAEQILKDWDIASYHRHQEARNGQ